MKNKQGAIFIKLLILGRNVYTGLYMYKIYIKISFLSSLIHLLTANRNAILLFFLELSYLEIIKKIKSIIL